jgi:hypothetical protein
VVEFGRLAGQLDGGLVDDLVEQRQRDRVLRGEVPAESARRHIGDGRDLVDGRLIETLPVAQFDRGVDEHRARALLLALAQTKRGPPPDISHDGDPKQAS